MSRTEYIAGVCNIGPAEIALRRGYGWGGLAVTVVSLALLVLLRPDTVWWFVVLIPSGVSACGFIQARKGFCAAFGLRHLFNFSGVVGEAEGVVARELWAADRNMALRILAMSLGVGLVVTGAALLLRFGLQ